MTRSKVKKKPDKRQEELPLSETPTLGDLMKWYEQAELVHRRWNTRKAYKTTMRAVVARFGERAMPTKGQLQAWLSERVRSTQMLPSSANITRAHLYRIYALARDLRWPLLLNAAAFPRLPDAPKKPEGLKDTYRSWPTLLAAMPDSRARAFLSLQRWEGLRVSEVLGLEWRHVKWDAEDGPEVLVEQQREARRTVPGPLKNDAAPAAFPLSAETVKLLRELQRDGMAQRPLHGAAGSLVGIRPCSDGATRKYIIPYFTIHVTAVARLMGEAVPHEFPSGIRGIRAPKRFHRLRHTFGTETVTTVGVEDARRYLRHKHIGTTALYADSVRGQKLNKDMLKKVREAAEERQARAVEEASRGISLSGNASTPGGVVTAVKPRG
jgi:integrase